MTTREMHVDHTGTFFHPVDYIVFGTMLILSAGVGIWYGIRSRKKRLYLASDYLIGGKEMTFGPVSLSLLASFMSSVTVLGVPAEYYMYGTMFSWFGLVYLYLPFIIIGIFIPVFYDLEIASAYEYLERRFNRATRLCVTCLYLILSLLYGGIVTYGPALALSRVTGMNLWGSILCTGVVCIFYTALGGLKAVIWTDVFQSILMLSGFFIVIIKGSIDLGGFSKIWQYAAEGERIDFVHFEIDPRIRHTFWTITIGGTILWTSIFGVNQSQVQRAVLIAGFGLTIILILAGMTGLTIYAYYRDCDPIKSRLVEKPDQLFPYAMMEMAGHLHGILGLFVAAVFSSSLSTISSGINAMACVTLEDFIRPATDWRELTYTRTSRVLVLLYGLSYIAFAYLASVIGGLIRMAYSIHAILGGPITAVFIVGMMTSWINEWGALSGLSAGIASTIWLFVGRSRFPPPPEYIRALPTYTNGCSVVSTSPAFASQNVTEQAKTEQFYGLNYSTWTEHSTITTGFFSLNEISDPETHRPGIAEFYSLSYLHASTVGFFTTILISMIISVATGKKKSSVPNELLVPCLRKSSIGNDAQEETEAKPDGIERSKSWFQPDRYSVHQKDMDQVGMVSATLSKPLLPPSEYDNADEDYPTTCTV